ncbi:MAG: sxtJ [Thiohalocapsa sp. PB-PSB1]|jgi:hypothetical protein|nr:MAG: hypothetical protein N838_11085 [Thiohalocapsa sp. PB-PSB1]QQO55300.1 MAG: sxtJ [Thiohalocapsa sp. PB-PSB1]
MSASLHPIPELDAEGLRHFALTTAAIIALLFGLFLPWLFGLHFPIWPWPLAGILVIWGLAAPRSLRPVYRRWMQFGLLLNRITTPLILGILYMIIFVPTGLIMRALRYDPMKRKLDPNLSTYRESSKPPTPESMKNPF